MNKLTGLWITASGLKAALMSVSSNMTVSGVPQCVVVPVIGNSGITGKKIGVDIINKFPLGTEAKVTVTWNGQEITLFSGRVIHCGFDNFIGAYSAQGSFVPVITLGHRMIDLSSVVLNTVLFNVSGVTYKPFIGEGDDASLFNQSVFNTKALTQKKLAVHIRDITALLADWWQWVSEGGEQVISVRDLVKASKCTFKSVIEKDTGIISDSVARNTAAILTRAVEGRQTFFSIIQALSGFCLLSIIPRLEDIVLVPETVGYKLPQGAPVFSRKYVVKVKHDATHNTVPINRVVVNASMVYTWANIDSAKGNEGATISGGGNYVGSFYPKVSKGALMTNAVQVSPPAILAGLLLKSLRYVEEGEAGSRVNTITTGTAGTTPGDQSGEVAITQSPQDSVSLGDATAKMMFGAVAYTGAGIEMVVAFEGLLEYSKNGPPWSDGSVYSLLGQVVGVDAPNPGNDSGVIQSFVGYVSKISIEVDLGAPALKCTIGMSNTRSKGDDSKHSLNLDENPLYNNVGTAGVE